MLNDNYVDNIKRLDGTTHVFFLLLTVS